jgi:hypothetical protein
LEVVAVGAAVVFWAGFACPEARAAYPDVEALPGVEDASADVPAIAKIITEGRINLFIFASARN